VTTESDPGTGLDGAELERVALQGMSSHAGALDALARMRRAVATIENSIVTIYPRDPEESPFDVPEFAQEEADQIAELIGAIEQKWGLGHE